MAQATITSKDGIKLTYNPFWEPRVKSACMSGSEVALVTARSVKAARELQTEAETWGADVEREGRALKIAF